MNPKPSKCQGCPFYGDGKGFVPDEIKEQAQVFVYGQNPGEDEEKEGKPFVGKTGASMEKTFFPLAGLTRENTSLGNAIRCRVKHTNTLPPLTGSSSRSALHEAMAHCHRMHFKRPEATRLFVAQGEYALYSLTQHGKDKYDKISDWRGYVLPFEPVGTPRSTSLDIYTPSKLCVLGTYHLAYLFRDPTASLVTRLDWSKAAKVIRGTWPKSLPEIKYGPPEAWPKLSAFDTEFDPAKKFFLCYSLCYDDAKGIRRVHVSDELTPGVLLHDNPQVIMHNAPADIQFLDKMLPGYEFDDTMHAHAVLWSDLPHDLGFLGSLYSSLNRWKHLDKLNPQVYSAGDAFATMEVWEKLSSEFAQDPASWKVYSTIQVKLVPLIMAAEAAGIAVNLDKAKDHYMKRQEIMDRLQDEAQAAVGWPINLRSNTQVGHHLYTVEGLLKLLGR